MADLYPGLFDGAAGAEAVVVNYTASEAIEIGAPVVAAAAGTGELQARVQPSIIGEDYCIGVVVGGDAEGIWVDGTVANDGEAAAAAGDVVKVCILGRCKLRVNASTGGANSAMAVGDPIAIGVADEIAHKQQADEYVFARALQVATGASDAILVNIVHEGERTIKAT